MTEGRRTLRLLCICALALSAVACGQDVEGAGGDLGGAPVVVGPTPGEPKDLSCPGCNLVLLNIGLLRPDHVGLYDGGRGATPHVDRFFRDGLVLEQAMAPSGTTYFSATAVATSTEAMFNTHDVLKGIGVPFGPAWIQGRGGRWCVLEMLEVEGRHLVDSVPTLAQTLSSAGYRTVSINDWIHTGRHVFLDRGFEEYVDLTGTPGMGLWEETSVVPVDQQVARVEEALRERGDRPLFLYFHPNTLHFPYPQPEGGQELVHIQTPDRATLQAAYAARVGELDRALSGLLDRLASEQWSGDTIVVLYSNHGLTLGFGERQPGMGTAYQSDVLAALLFRHPRVDGPSRIEEPVSLVDLGPTLLEMVGVPASAETTAHSMRELMQGTGPYGREFVFGRDLQQEYARQGRWKLVRDGRGGVELFDLSTDPGEVEDVRALHLDVVARLTSALDQEHVEQLRHAERIRTELDPPGQ